MNLYLSIDPISVKIIIYKVIVCLTILPQVQRIIIRPRWLFRPRSVSHPFFLSGGFICDHNKSRKCYLKLYHFKNTTINILFSATRTIKKSKKILFTANNKLGQDYIGSYFVFACNVMQEQYIMLIYNICYFSLREEEEEWSIKLEDELE